MSDVVGREGLASRLDALVATERWVTLVGPPGSGKTVLARGVASRHGSGVWVAAGQHADVPAVLDACLDAFGVSRVPGENRLAALRRAVDRPGTLLVLDGVGTEHDGLAAALEDLVGDSGSGSILVTALAVGGSENERVVRVGPLPVPRPDEPLPGPAYELLASRVEASGGHRLDPDAHGPAIRRLLAASGGLPLVLTQLAAQIALVGVTNVEPTTTPSEVVERSYALLDPRHQRLFRRFALLGVPVGLDVLAAVDGADRGEVVEAVAGLAGRHLVESLPDGRFDMLAPIRAQAAALAGPADRDAVTDGVLAWAEQVLSPDVDAGAADADWLDHVPVVRSAVAAAGDSARSRDQGYRIANRTFGSLYTAMRAREALEILQTALASGDGPPDVGAQVARRAAISASEVHGTYEGVRLLDRAEEYARTAAHPRREQARNASIRAEMHLDAGQLDAAAAEATRAVDLDSDSYAVRQGRRTLVDVHVSRGELARAEALAPAVLDDPPPAEQWLGLAARVLLARIAWEQGRPREAAAVARTVRDEATADAEDRIALLADTLLRQITGGSATVEVDRAQLPWAVRIGVLLQDARELLAGGECRRCLTEAAELVALADTSRLGRDAVEARILLADALVACGDPDEAVSTYLAALRHAAECPLPLRCADALDGIASLLRAAGPGHREAASGARLCAAAARGVRAAHGAARVARPGAPEPVPAPARPPAGWVRRGRLLPAGLEAVSLLVAERTRGEEPDGALSALTATQTTVARLVATGLTSRQVAERLSVSPRTIDAHLAHIYRKLGISSRARLASLVADQG